MDQTDSNNGSNTFDGFEKGLNPITNRYLSSKFQRLSETDSLQKIDLRHMCENVLSELQTLENEAAFDYLKVEFNVNELNDQIKQTDTILNNLEDWLISYKDNLDNIKNEMANVQERSKKMNTSLNNRKSLHKSLENFIDSVLLEPQLIYNLCIKEVNEEYIEYMKILCTKLDYLKKNGFSETVCAKELEPELKKLKIKVCEKVKAFIMEKLELFAKPKTNIIILQKSMIKYSIFLYYLKDYFTEEFIKICYFYIDLMGKIYTDSFKYYISEYMKLTIELYNKNDTIFHDNIQYMRSALQTKTSNMIFDNRSIFSLMGRDSVLEKSDDDHFILPIVLQKNMKISMEVCFKAINKFLIETLFSEHQFITEFFLVNQEQHKFIFGNLFKNIALFMLEQIKYMLSASNDCIGILLILLINNKNKEFCNNRKIFSLDSYFDQINQIVWFRFKEMFDIHINIIRNLNIKLFKQNEKTMGSKVILLRWVDFSLTLYRVASSNTDNNMLKIRITELKTLIIDLLKKSSREISNAIERTAYLISSIEFILSNLIGNNFVFPEDILALEKEANIHIDTIIEIGLHDYFDNLINFVSQNIKNEDEDTMKVSGAFGPNIYIPNNNNLINYGTYGSYDNQTLSTSINYRLIENIGNEFNENWSRKIDSFKDMCYKYFNNSMAYKKIMKKFLQNLLNNYAKFNKYVKENYMSYWNNIPQLHVIMKEIQNQERKLN